MKTNNFLFDFDGTISNSIAGIQVSYDHAYELLFQEKNTKDLYHSIGPPIQFILQKNRPHTTPDEIHNFLSVFRNHYDLEGHSINTLYEGAVEVIKQLYKENKNLYITTFKRRVPLIKILEEYDLLHFFKDIYTYDKPDGTNYSSKSFMVKELLENHNLELGQTILVGDSMDDSKAASDNNIRFIFASYGYGKELPFDYTIKNPLEILTIVN